MASIVTRPNGRREIQFKRPDGKRATIRLGKMSKSDASDFRDKVERLLACILSQQPLPIQLAAWVGALPSPTHKKLSSVGLIEERPDLTLGGLVDHFLKHKQGKPRTLKKYENAAENLKTFFGEDRSLDAITPGDADEFKVYLQTAANRLKSKEGEGLAPQTAQKRLQKAGSIFKAAVRKNWIPVNPFDGVVITHAPPIPGRVHFIDAGLTYKLLDACEDLVFQHLLANVRFGGLRHTSETSLLRWSWVDWGADTITFRSPKTEHLPGRDWRTIPIFAEYRPYLEAAHARLPEGAPDLIFPDLDDDGAKTSKQLARLCRRVGIEPWPKPWVNLRSTRETEIEELYGLRCACDWIGNTEVVAKRSYLQVTQAHHARAIADGAGAKRPPAGGAVEAAQKTQ